MDRDRLNVNGEGYADLTASEAIKAADTPPKSLKWLIKTYKELAHLMGYEIIGRITIKDKDTGRIWR